MPSTRPWSSAWELTSIATAWAPASRSCAISACVRSTSGVVNPVVTAWPYRPTPKVPMVPLQVPRRLQAWASNCTVEVLPLVPVTPTTVIAALGPP